MIRVLVVDDSALARNVLRRGLEEAEGIEVVGAAADPYEARDLLVKHRPDVMTLDIEMPKMDGLTFLERVMAAMPTRTIVVSSLAQSGSAAALRALELGAIDVVGKPAGEYGRGLQDMMADLVQRVRVAADARLVRRTPAGPPQERTEAPLVSTDAVIGLGASTGGVAALGRILPLFPPAAPGVVVVQHIPAGFTRGFAERLDALCAMRVREAADGDRVLRGHVLVAPGGGKHLIVRRVGGEYRVSLIADPGGSLHVPSVDRFFGSLAEAAGRNAAACLMTGMGRDGAEGLAALRAAGGRTFAQDEATSAVWGMPGAAMASGAAEAAIPLDQVPATLVRAVAERKG